MTPERLSAIAEQITEVAARLGEIPGEIAEADADGESIRDIRPALKHLLTTLESQLMHCRERLMLE